MTQPKLNKWDVRYMEKAYHVMLFSSPGAMQAKLCSCWPTQSEAWNAARILAKARRCKAFLHSDLKHGIRDSADYTSGLKGRPRSSAEAGATQPEAATPEGDL